jgi:hypothetical protein
MERIPSPGAARVNLALAAVVAAVGLLVAVARVTPDVQASAVAEAMPVQSVTWLRDHPESGRRVFNVYAWGGYVGRELSDSLVYIDGRSDIYGDAPIREYANAITLAADPAPLLDRAEIDTIVFWPGSPFAGWLDRNGWHRVHEDAVSAVWERGAEAR